MAGTMANCAENSEAIARFSDAFGLFVGRGRRFSVEALAAATGIPARTIRAYKDGEACPGHLNLITLMAVLPPAFCNEVIAPAGLEAARRAEGGDPCTYAANRAVLTAAQRLGEMLADGRFCQKDQDELAEVVFPQLIERLQGWLAANRDGA